MERKVTLTRPELLTLAENGAAWRGADQAWFPEEKQQKAGCGATAAAHLARYLAGTRPECLPLYPSGSQHRADFLALMEEMWRYVTPGRLGVHTLRMLRKGLTAFAARRGVALSVRELDVPPLLPAARPTADQCAAFLRTALRADCPVAFLNLSPGRCRELEGWHWTTVVETEEQPEGPILCTVLDGGRELTVDFRLWLMTTRLGGGLLYLPREGVI